MQPFGELNEAEKQQNELSLNILKIEAKEANIENIIEKPAVPSSQKKEESVSSTLGTKEIPKISIETKDLAKKHIKFTDLFALAARTFRVKLGMTMLTILGIGVSFATIFFLVSLGYGIEKVMLDQFASGNLLRTVDVASPNNEVTPITKSIADKIGKFPGVSYSEPVFAIQGQIEEGAKAAEVEIRGAGPKYFDVFGGNLKSGRVFKPGEKAVVISGSFLQTMDKQSLADFREPLIITAYQNYTENDVPKQKTVSLGSFTVVGIDNDTDNSNVYIDPSVISGMVSQYSAIKILVTTDKDVTPVRSLISNLGFMTSSVLDTVDQATKVFSILEVLLALFGTASLIVATIGMVNTMTVSLLERTQEIGVMKVLGVSDTDVKKLFLLEASIIGGLGGLSGMIMGFVFSQAFNFMINFLARNLGGKSVSLFYYPIWFVVGVTASSFVIGILTGIIPAQRASNMDPINAVKYK